jgi:C-terminal processing protease CtpA/Prc
LVLLQCEIESLVPGSPASAVNLRSGDNVTAINGVRVISVAEAIKKIKAADGPVRLTVLRENSDDAANFGDVSL